MSYFSTSSLNVLPAQVSTSSTHLEKSRFKASGAHQIALMATGTKTGKNKKHVEDNFFVKSALNFNYSELFCEYISLDICHRNFYIRTHFQIVLHY